MAAKDLLIDDGGEGQTVEAIRERFPQFDIVSAFALVVESVYAVNRRALVVTSQQKEVFGVFDLIT